MARLAAARKYWILWKLILPAIYDLWSVKAVTTTAAEGNGTCADIVLLKWWLRNMN
jgi:hypothetical protein